MTCQNVHENTVALDFGSYRLLNFEIMVFYDDYAHDVYANKKCNDGS